MLRHSHREIVDKKFHFGFFFHDRNGDLQNENNTYCLQKKKKKKNSKIRSKFCNLKIDQQSANISKIAYAIFCFGSRLRHRPKTFAGGKKRCQRRRTRRRISTEMSKFVTTQMTVKFFFFRKTYKNLPKVAGEGKKRVENDVIFFILRGFLRRFYCVYSSGA